MKDALGQVGTYRLVAEGISTVRAFQQETVGSEPELVSERGFRSSETRRPHQENECE